MEIWFYHLQSQTLERALPTLLDLTLRKPWRAVVEVGGGEAGAGRLAALDDVLWTYADDSFLPHGTDADPDPARHPVVLTCGSGNPNQADVRFLVAGARWSAQHAGYARLMLLFDGRDPDATAAAREDWKRVRAAGQTATYWQQDETGRWERKA